MAESVLAHPEPQALNNFVRARAKELRAGDEPPATRKAWEDRKSSLREAMLTAMGPFPASPCPLDARILGVLKRDGYHIEKVVFQSRPDVWVTANAYVPQDGKSKRPGILAVHGHWPWARIDPAVQPFCLGLVKLGYFVLVVDAFGAGERFTTPAAGAYHGGLYGGTLWPAGQTLLGMQVYDNRRAVDYLLSREEVDGSCLGITGASGGGNQTMYAGALDERLRVAVPVCSVGNFQAYLQASCCICEVLPGALRFTEEGDILGLVAPRALLVINATKDGIQFSPAEAAKSVTRARGIFKLYGAEDKLRHDLFEAGHGYHQPMREAMYGWMNRWLRDEGDGKPVAEPKFDIEKPEDLRCYPDNIRPKGFLFPPSFAARAGRALVEKLTSIKPDHVEDWESTAVYMRSRLRKQVFGDFPTVPAAAARVGKADVADQVTITPLVLYPEPELPLPVLLQNKAHPEGRQPICVLLHLDGKKEAFEHPLAGAILDKGWFVAAPDLRGTGETKPAEDGSHTAVDHNSAQHAVWIGRPLLGQWVFDVSCLLNWLLIQPGMDTRRCAVVGLGQAGVVALCAAALLEEQIISAAAIDAPVSFITEEAYASGTRMGLLAPGILTVGDIPHLAALTAPRRLMIAGGVTPQNQKTEEGELKNAFSFCRSIFALYKAERNLLVKARPGIDELGEAL